MVIKNCNVLFVVNDEEKAPEIRMALNLEKAEYTSESVKQIEAVFIHHAVVIDCGK